MTAKHTKNVEKKTTGKRAERKNEKKKAERQNREAELLAQLQRLQAEFENYQKRTSQEVATEKKRANSNLITLLLPVLDNFELALKNASKEPKCKDSFYKGVELIYAQLMEVLEQHGLSMINPVKDVFDPRFHEALMTEQKNGAPKNTITEVLQKGYELHGKILRTAKVKVAQ